MPKVVTHKDEMDAALAKQAREELCRRREQEALYPAYSGGGLPFIALKVERLFRVVSDETDSAIHNHIAKELGKVIAGQFTEDRSLWEDLARVILKHIKQTDILWQQRKGTKHA